VAQLDEEPQVRVIGVLLACAGLFLAAVSTGAVATVAGTSLADTTVTARFPSGTVSPGSHGTAVTGRVTGPAGRRVLVQARTATGWLTLAGAVSRSDNTFSVPAPTWWAGRRTYRVFAPATAEAGEADSDSGSFTVTRRYRPRSGTAYRHLGVDKARWDPCRVISYRVNPNRLPAGALSDVQEAFRRLSSATGLRFSYAGTTSFLPYARGSSRRLTGADLAVAWAPPRTVPGLAGRVVGLGGYAGASTSTRWTQITQGYVVLDSTSRLAAGFRGHRSTRGTALLHELGHAVGLDHVTDRRQVMYPVMLARAAQYAAGDLRGLNAVGAAQGCFPTSGAGRSSGRVVAPVFPAPRP
jgi:hypothetical protein